MTIIQESNVQSSIIIVDPTYISLDNALQLVSEYPDIYFILVLCAGNHHSSVHIPSNVKHIELLPYANLI